MPHAARRSCRTRTSRCGAVATQAHVHEHGLADAGDTARRPPGEQWRSWPSTPPTLAHLVQVQIRPLACSHRRSTCSSCTPGPSCRPCCSDPLQLGEQARVAARRLGRMTLSRSVRSRSQRRRRALPSSQTPLTCSPTPTVFPRPPAGVRLKVQRYVSTALPEQPEPCQQPAVPHHRAAAKRAACSALLSSPRKREAAALARLYGTHTAPTVVPTAASCSSSSAAAAGTPAAAAATRPAAPEDSLWAAAAAPSLASLAKRAPPGALGPPGLPSAEEPILQGSAAGAPGHHPAQAAPGGGPRRSGSAGRGRGEANRDAVTPLVLGSEALDASVKAAMVASLHAELAEAEARVLALKRRLADLAG